MTTELQVRDINPGKTPKETGFVPSISKSILSAPASLPCHMSVNENAGEEFPVPLEAYPDFSSMKDKVSLYSMKTTILLNISDMITNLFNAIEAREPGKQFSTPREADILIKLSKCIRIIENSFKPRRPKPTIKQWNDLVKFVLNSKV